MQSAVAAGRDVYPVLLSFVAGDVRGERVKSGGRESVGRRRGRAVIHGYDQMLQAGGNKRHTGVRMSIHPHDSKPRDLKIIKTGLAMVGKETNMTKKHFNIQQLHG